MRIHLNVLVANYLVFKSIILQLFDLLRVIQVLNLKIVLKTVFFIEIPEICHLNVVLLHSLLFILLATFWLEQEFKEGIH